MILVIIQCVGLDLTHALNVTCATVTPADLLPPKEDDMFIPPHWQIRFCSVSFMNEVKSALLTCKYKNYIFFSCLSVKNMNFEIMYAAPK